MEHRIDTSIIANASKNDTYMPYFLNEDNDIFFKECLSELYAQLAEENEDALYYNGKKITEKDWVHSKLVGSLFITLFCHWTKIIQQTNMFFIEVMDGFPEDLTLDIDEKSFVLFYRSKSGMISKRDECILESDDDWINTYFDWVYSELNEVGTIQALADKYKAFLQVFSSEDMPVEKEDENHETYFEFSEDFYQNMNTMRESIVAALEEEGEILPEIVMNKARKTIEPVTVNFKWNGIDTSLNFPINITESLSNGSLDISLFDNKNGWLAQQEKHIQETVVAFLAYFVYQSHEAQSIKEDKDEISITWADLGINVRTWLRTNCPPEASKIDKKIHATYSYLTGSGAIDKFAFSEFVEKFMKAILYIEKQSATSGGKGCLIDVENVQNQYFFALNNTNVLTQIWEGITQEKIVKNKTRPTFTSQFDTLKEKFPNFKEVIDYYSGAMYIFEQTGTPPSPILLLGSPGLGKTHFSNEVAKVVGSMMTLIPVSSLSAGWIISGSAAQWKDAQMGKVASALLNGASLSPVIVLDEIDKKSEGNNDPLGALYPLLEYQTAKEFVDEYLEFPIDASNVIWVATANSLNTIPEPILDRFVVFDVARLSKEETIKVAQNIFIDLTRGLTPQTLSPEILEILQDKTPRQIKQVLKKALAYAAVQRTQNINLQKEHLDLKAKIKKIGF
jgi:ATP-dependent Lon protease